jgi:hypothetical protein
MKNKVLFYLLAYLLLTNDLFASDKKHYTDCLKHLYEKTQESLDC